jgi:hypothetical protein
MLLVEDARECMGDWEMVFEGVKGSIGGKYIPS